MKIKQYQDELNPVVFINRSQWVDELSVIEDSPAAALFSAWDSGEYNFHEIRSLLEKLISMGCKYFVCAGGNSEALHDYIDDVIQDLSLDSPGTGCENIMTTWHDSDEDGEVAEFFLYSTNASNNPLLVFLDDDRVEDRGIKKAILDLVGGEHRS